MKLSKEDIQKFATEDEKKILKEYEEFKGPNFRNLICDIFKLKKRLIALHHRYGARENFGVDKIRDLKDKWDYNSLRYGSQEERKMAGLIDELSHWAGYYNGEETERPKWTVKGASFGKMPWDVKESKELSERRRGYVQLYKSQIKIIDKFIEDNFNKIKRGGLWFNVDDWPELYEEVAAVRETETLYQDINRYVSDKLSDMPRREWEEESFDSLLNNDDKEALLEINNYNNREFLKESLADSIAMRYIEDSNGILDVWEDTVRKMTPEELGETEFEFESARDGITWYIQKWTIPGEHREEKKEIRKLYQKYLNRLRKVKKEMKLKKPDFSKTVDTDRIKNLSDEEAKTILKMFGEDVEKYTTEDEKKILAEEKNEKGKTRKVDNPYEIYKGDDYGYRDWEWRILKHYQTPEKEKNNPYARVFCAVKSPMTYDSWEYGDTYCKDIPGYKYEDESKSEPIKKNSTYNLNMNTQSGKIAAIVRELGYADNKHDEEIEALIEMSPEELDATLVTLGLK